MTHFARIQNGIVTNVIVIEQDMIDTGSWGPPEEWIQTSYNTYGGVHRNGKTPLRKNYAGIGYSYDEVLDAFIPPKPYDSWSLNLNTCLWEPPVEYPQDGNVYTWNEQDQQWDLLITKPAMEE